jgi:hypothetical protein
MKSYGTLDCVQACQTVCDVPASAFAHMTTNVTLGGHVSQGFAILASIHKA